MEPANELAILKRKRNEEMDPTHGAKKRKNDQREPNPTGNGVEALVTLENQDHIVKTSPEPSLSGKWTGDRKQKDLPQPLPQKEGGKKRRGRRGQGSQDNRVKESGNANGVLKTTKAPQKNSSSSGTGSSVRTRTSPGAIEQISESANGKPEFMQRERHPAAQMTSNQQSKKRRHKTKMVKKEQWNILPPAGGKFIDADPLFTRDKKCMILATDTAAFTFSTSNSLMLQTFSNGSSGRTVAYCLSSVEPDVLYVATDKSHVLKWNLLDGQRLGRWVVSGKLQCIQAAQMSKSDVDTLIIVDQSDKGWHIAAHRFGSPDDPTKTDLAILVELQKPIRSIKIAEDGTTIVGLTLDGLLLGNAESSVADDLKALKFTWHQVKCTEMPTCFDVRFSPMAKSRNNLKDKPNQSLNRSVDVVVGGIKGCLFLYRNILNRVTQSFQNQRTKDAPNTAPSQMHWHREAVGAVAWSRDGNYIITGGKETVLVIWQLETGRKQFLPHLESVVRNIVVSPDGASYAVHLGDNSTMILSTTELTPTANVVGLQTLGYVFGALQLPMLATVESMAQQSSLESSHTVACTVNPTNPNHILAVVPAYQTDANAAAGPVSAPYLQTFDITSSTHVARQALTRVNATSSNLGPEGNRLLEPDVKLVKLTSDGQWLATVEEWAIPKKDTKDLTLGNSQETGQNKDVQLKFWSWNNDTREWVLNTRIAAPHQSDGSPLCEVILDMAVHPSSNRFASLGTDSLVHVWRPKRHHSTNVRGRTKSDQEAADSNMSETWWTLEYSIALPTSLVSDSVDTLSSRRGKLSFSADGSVLAAYQRFDRDNQNSRDILHFVNMEQHSIHHSRGNILNGQDIHDFGFIDKYLVCVGREKLCVWDTTTFEMRCDISLSSLSTTAGAKHDPSTNRLLDSKPFARLAIDASSNTFAVAVPQLAKKITLSPANALLNYTTQLYIFSPSMLPKVEFEANLPYATLALMSAGGSSNIENGIDNLTMFCKGYLLLDASASVSRVQLTTSSSSTKTLQPLITGSVAETSSSVSTTDIGSNGNLLSLMEAEAADVESEVEEENNPKAWISLFAQTDDSRPVVRTQELANVFDHPSHAMPSMKDMFRSVMSLYAGKA